MLKGDLFLEFLTSGGQLLTLVRWTVTVFVLFLVALSNPLRIIKSRWLKNPHFWLNYINYIVLTLLTHK